MGEALDKYPGAASALVELGVQAIWLDPPPAWRKDRAQLVDKGPPIDVKPPWGNSPADPYEVPMIFEDNDENLTKVAAQFEVIAASDCPQSSRVILWFSVYPAPGDCSLPLSLAPLSG